MTFPLYTALATGLLVVLQQLLMLTVGMHRTRLQLGVGIGDDPNLERLVRRHGNLAENAAIVLLTLGLLESLMGQTLIVVSLVSLFVVGRGLHAVGFSSLTGSHLEEGSRVFLAARVGGAMLTAGTGLGAGTYLAYLAFGSM